MLSTSISRRSLLRIVGVGVPVFFLRTPSLVAAAGEPVVTKTRRPFARVMNTGVPVREQPSVKARLVRNLKWNEVVAVSGEVLYDESPSAYNKLWYRTADGYVHSRFMQPVENAPQPVERSVPVDGFWAQTALASIIVRYKPDPLAGSAYPMQLPFGTNLQVLEVVQGVDKNPWYRVSDGIGEQFFVPAESLRRLGADDFAPIAPEVPLHDKRIDVNIKKQIVVAYENDKEVFRARCATGARFTMDDGSVKDYGTTTGDHRIFLKTPSRRMIGGTKGQTDFYDLPGIPWVSYFTASRIAFHGAYWHNDFGYPRSHGCVNLLPEDSQWVYRWTTPVVTFGERWTKVARSDDGSLVRVF
ncbi:MAG: L,D-transpeptidase family protein [Chloroflexi bacterium]|nr:L,D-transpeptidase family protein [Chloroflexota bacterium]